MLESRLATAERLAGGGAHVAMNDLPIAALDQAVARLDSAGFRVHAP